jgi:hypothetical protein
VPCNRAPISCDETEDAEDVLESLVGSAVAGDELQVLRDLSVGELSSERLEEVVVPGVVGSTLLLRGSSALLVVPGLQLPIW